MGRWSKVDISKISSPKQDISQFDRKTLDPDESITIWTHAMAAIDGSKFKEVE
jgi:hypothetical protein